MYPFPLLQLLTFIFVLTPWRLKESMYVWMYVCNNMLANLGSPLEIDTNLISSIRAFRPAPLGSEGEHLHGI